MILQLESDFLQVNRNMFGDRIIDPSLFSKIWPQLAPRVIEICKKSRMKEVKEFLKIHQNSIEQSDYYCLHQYIQSKFYCKFLVL